MTEQDSTNFLENIKKHLRTDKAPIMDLAYASDAIEGIHRTIMDLDNEDKPDIRHIVRVAHALPIIAKMIDAYQGDIDTLYSNMQALFRDSDLIDAEKGEDYVQ